MAAKTFPATADAEHARVKNHPDPVKVDPAAA
jgi:hypothetical protein